MNLLLVETKVTALQVIRQLSQNLKHLFWSYVPQFWQVEVDALKTIHPGAVRWEGINALPIIVSVAIDSMQFSQTADQIGPQLNNSVGNGSNNNSNNNNGKKATEADLINLTRDSLQLLIGVLNEGRKSGLVNETARAIEKIFDLVPKNVMSKSLNNNEIAILNEILCKVFKCMGEIQRYVETMIEAKKNRVNWDEIDDSFLEEEKETEEHSLYNLANLITRFVKQFGDEFIPLLDKNAHIMETVVKMLDMPQDNEQTASLSHKTGVYIVCDIYESCSAKHTVKYVDLFLPKLGKILEIDPSYAVSHPSFYGLGLIVEKCKDTPAVFKYVSNIVSVCGKCIEKHSKEYKEITQIDHDAPEGADYGLNDDLVGMVDNAVSCIFKLIRFINWQEFDKENNNNNNNNNSVNRNDLVKIWFDHLPIKYDCVEAVPNHEFLIECVKNKHPLILGEQGQNIPRIVEIMLDIWDTGLSSPDLDDIIRDFITTVEY